jgi:hypothetical protein
MNTAVVEGKVVKVGDYVCFKCDVEQCGKLVQVLNFGRVLVLESGRDEGFSGDYIGGQARTQVAATDCWVE